MLLAYGTASCTFAEAARALPLKGTKSAVALLRGSAGVEGTAHLSQEGNEPTVIHLQVKGLSPGKHGFHVHEFGDTTNGCISTGPHFNPRGFSHGSPQDAIRHAGDLGNVLADSRGVVETTIIDLQLPLSGLNSVIGRACVIHELEDDLGKGGHRLSPTTGNAGGRLACGVIGLCPPRATLCGKL